MSQPPSVPPPPVPDGVPAPPFTPPSSAPPPAPPAAARPQSAKRGRKWVIVVVAAVVVVALAVMLLRPRYEVEVAGLHEPVAGAAMPVTVVISNAGMWSGTFIETVSMDGRPLQDLHVEVAGRDSVSVDVELSADLAPGEHVLRVGESEVAFRLLEPAAFAVTDLETPERTVRSGARVNVTALIENTGDADGEFAAVVRVDGRRVAARDVFVAGGDTVTEDFTVKLSGARRHTIKVGTRSLVVRSVSVTRPANGQIVTWAVGRGMGKLIVKGGESDGVAVLASTGSRRRPLIAVYVRAGSKATVSGVPDGRYYVYYSLGSSWAPSLKRFLALDNRGRFLSPHTFNTRYTSTVVWYEVLTIGLRTTSYGQGEPVRSVPDSEYPAL